MDDGVPLLLICDLFGSTKTDSISPKMAHSSYLKFKISQGLFRILQVNFDKLKIELVKICFYVDTLFFWIYILTYQHIVRVHFKSPIFSKHNSYSVLLIGLRINFRYLAIFHKWRLGELSFIHNYTLLNELQFFSLLLIFRYLNL